MTTARRAGSFAVRVASAQPPREAWRRLVDLDRHTRAVPLTRLLVREERDGAAAMPSSAALVRGSTFTARTRVGPVVLDDVMVVEEATAPDDGTQHQPAAPGVWRIRKIGKVIRGDVQAVVAADGAGSEVTWRQVYDVRGVPRPLVRWSAPLVGLGYRVVLARILAD
ncbi:hypothetical protein MM440_05400 [Arsenicicoccus piscis]|uniref:SRPBCC family protein n=1 Tax=Arsenicicoccus piscis TaxID=673954 RepID=A0ABQ6HM91_9MICO|nr:hypothetical protein [Arsenicicoccus piscis]MCH8627234.1 hypothetical protein [Arsenicicoccus piscis]GMA18788.1 hypothetical protein GCM10025862_08090 [Arsenicicoccus piscis]